MAKRKDKTAAMFTGADLGEIDPTERKWRQKKFMAARQVAALLEEEPSAFVTRAAIPRKVKRGGMLVDLYVASVVIPGELGRFRSVEIDENAMSDLLRSGAILEKPGRTRWGLSESRPYSSSHVQSGK